MLGTVLQEHALGFKPKGKKKTVRSTAHGPSSLAPPAGGSIQASSDSLDITLMESHPSLELPPAPTPEAPQSHPSPLLRLEEEEIEEEEMVLSQKRQKSVIEGYYLTPCPRPWMSFALQGWVEVFQLILSSGAVWYRAPNCGGCQCVERHVTHKATLTQSWKVYW